MSYQETQETITDWAASVFGPAQSNLRIAIRANEEMAELLRCLSVNDHHPMAPEELADVVIILYRLADCLGVNLHSVVDAKMSVNRTQRTWERDGSGHGYHVRSVDLSTTNAPQGDHHDG